MIKVLDKTFQILELLACAAPEPLSPQELARQLDLNRATCSRLLRELLDNGYVIRHSRQKGYLPGPKILALSNQSAFQEDLLVFARPVIDNYSRELCNSMLITRIYGGKRYVLYHKNGNPAVKITMEKLAFDDIFCTATGLLDAAYLPPEEQRDLFLSQQNAGGGFFSELQHENAALEKLTAIRREQWVDCRKEEQWIYAAPVFRDNSFTAALGLSIPLFEHNDDYHSKACRLVRQAAQEISRKISTFHSA